MQIRRTTFGARHMAFKTYVGPVDGIAAAIPPLLDEVREAGGEPDGAPVVLYPSTEQDPRSILARLCVPVDAAFAGTPQLRTLVLGAVDVAVAHYSGPYRDIGHAYEALAAWVAHEGLSLAEGVSETFVAGPDGEGADATWRIDVAVRIKAPGP